MKAKRCPVCNTLYPSFKRECPNCFYKEPFDVDYILAIFLILVILFLIEILFVLEIFIWFTLLHVFKYSIAMLANESFSHIKV
jgi:hypothetical protein